MALDDSELRRLLVGVGVTIGVRRYVGQHPTEAAHEFAESALPVVKAIEDRIVDRIARGEK
jgi:hypothetical protein